MLSPRPVFFCAHPWPIGLTRHCASRCMERGGVGVGGGFYFTFWLAHCNVLALPPLFSLNALQLPGHFSCGGYYTLQLLHIVHLIIALSTGVDRGNRN